MEMEIRECPSKFFCLIVKNFLRGTVQCVKVLKFFFLNRGLSLFSIEYFLCPFSGKTSYVNVYVL